MKRLLILVLIAGKIYGGPPEGEDPRTHVVCAPTDKGCWQTKHVYENHLLTVAWCAKMYTTHPKTYSACMQAATDHYKFAAQMAKFKK